MSCLMGLGFPFLERFINAWWPRLGGCKRRPCIASSAAKLRELRIALVMAAAGCGSVEVSKRRPSTGQEPNERAEP